VFSSTHFSVLVAAAPLPAAAPALTAPAVAAAEGAKLPFEVRSWDSNSLALMLQLLSTSQLCRSTLLPPPRPCRLLLPPTAAVLTP
jgi:hypothetical protein